MHHNHHCTEDHIFEHLAQNPELESGLHKIEENPNQDPVVRQLATVMLQECERAKRRRANRKMGSIIGCVIGVVICIIVFAIIVPSKRRHQV